MSRNRTNTGFSRPLEGPDTMFKDEIIDSFGSNIDDPNLLRSCEEIAKIFSLSAEELYINWESFVVTKHNGKRLEYSVENLLKLQEYIQSNLQKKRQNTGSSMKINRKINLSNVSDQFNFLPTTPSLLKRKNKTADSDKTPIRKLVSASVTPGLNNGTSSSSASILTPTPLKSSIEPSGTVVETLNPEGISISNGFDPDLDNDNPVKLFANFDPRKYQFRTMRTKLLETADVLDEQIDMFAKIVQEHHKFQPSDFNNPTIISQSEIVCVGRIVADNPHTPADISLNSASLSLETSRILGIGSRVPLDLSGLEDYSFFPGQIVALKGKNASGEYFKVNEVVEIPLLGAPVTGKSEIESYGSSMTEDLKIIITAGAYTTTKDLDFEHLHNLVHKINDEIKPHVVIMLGPFVDITHPLVATGEIEEEFNDATKKPKTLDEIFKFIIAPILNKINIKIQVIIIPSLKDAVSKHDVYPQDSLDRKSLHLNKNFKTFPNPSIFQINESLFGVSNNDIFKDLKDVSHGKYVKQNRFDRITSHIISQRRFYPAFPGSIKTRKRKIDNQEFVEPLPSSELDIPYLGLSEFGDVIPDIIIIPSELRFFARIIKNVLVVNPGSFMRPGGAGTFAQITIKRPNLTDLNIADVPGADEETYSNSIWKRSRVDILKT